MKEHGRSSDEDDNGNFPGADPTWLHTSQFEDWSPDFQNRLNELEQETQALSAALEELLSRSRSQTSKD